MDDGSVAVEVVGRVFVEGAVVVVIDGTDVGAVVLAGERDAAAIGIDVGDDVESTGINQVMNRFVVDIIALKQHIDDVKGSFAAEEFAAVDVAVAVEGGFFGGGPGGGVVDFERVNRFTATTYADFDEGGEVGILVS